MEHQRPVLLRPLKREPGEAAAAPDDPTGVPEVIVKREPGAAAPAPDDPGPPEDPGDGDEDDGGSAWEDDDPAELDEMAEALKPLVLRRKLPLEGMSEAELLRSTDNLVTLLTRNFKGCSNVQVCRTK